jgi:hypothetical protein
MRMEVGRIRRRALIRAIAVASSIVAFGPLDAAAQATDDIRLVGPLFAGACEVVIQVRESDVDAVLSVELNKGAISSTRVPAGSDLVVVPLGIPLTTGDEIRARLDRGAWRSLRAEPGGLADPACGGRRAPPADDVPVFEAMGFLGKAFDQFAPNQAGNYAEGGEAAQDTRSRTTAGLTFDYRFFGSERDWAQFWVGGAILYGLRSADVVCEEGSDIPVCSSSATVQDKFLFVLEHASTVEAHLAPRLEFLTLQRHSDTPLKAYVGGQFGFVQLEGAPKVLEMDHVGIGVRVPSGSFRNSFVQWSWGRSTLFQSNPKWNRFKVTAALAFDLAPGLADRLQFWKYGGLGAFRGFLAVSIDRNLRGPGPDAVQTYVGFAFDFRRAFIRP